MSDIPGGSLGHFFRRERPRVYLGSVWIAPRSKIKDSLEDLIWQGSENVPHEIRDALVEIFALPPVRVRETGRKTDLVLDVMVPDYRLGGDLFATTDWGVFCFLWRPRLTVAARLVQIETDKTRRTFKATQILSWKEFVLRSFLNPFRSSSTDGEVKILLYKATAKILIEIKKALD